MIELINNGVYLVKESILINKDKNLSIEEVNSKLLKKGKSPVSQADFDNSQKGNIASGILTSHNTNDNEDFLKIKFDAMASHDITYVGIVQTARASGLKEFPLPYVLTNCHNSLCAVGGTINEDDHVFGLSAVKKYGGIYVPAHQAVIHQYMREMMAGCGKMILGSDSHTRYGALGTMAIGEGGPELVKQLLERTYDVKYPEVVLVYLENSPKLGVGPQDVALSIIGKVFKNGFVKNKVLEFVGPGIEGLSVDFRNGIDVMTTEAACLTSIWKTDNNVKQYLTMHGRGNEYLELKPKDVAYYDKAIRVDLSTIEPTIALPFHPSNTYTIDEVNENLEDILHSVEVDAAKIFGTSNIDFKLTDKIENGKLRVDQAVVAGCSGGTYENIESVAKILDGKTPGDTDFWLSVYPASQPVYIQLTKTGAMTKLMTSGASIRSAFCGPCFGAGDVPANNSLSIRHTTRNFPNREGSKPGDGQISYVALMDARSIAATTLNGGILTKGTDVDFDFDIPEYKFDDTVYKNRVFNGYKKADNTKELKFGPNIKNWPEMIKLCDNIVLKVTSVIDDEVTTTDELIPSGETSSYRSNPLKLAEFALSRKDPEYVSRAKEAMALETSRKNDESNIELEELLKKVGLDKKNTCIGSTIYANKPGDGSAREQAASVQKVLGGWANISIDYATKRYRSNLINWGILPFTTDESNRYAFEIGDVVVVEDIKDIVASGKELMPARIYKKNEKIVEIELKLENISEDERQIILDGCLINYYKMGR